MNSSSVGIILPFLLPVIVFIIFKFLSLNPLRKKAKMLGGRMNRRGECIFNIQGKEVYLQFFPPSRYRPRAEWTMALAGSFPAELKIRSETSQDRFFKSLKLNHEVQIFDPQLNEKFYFECDVDEFLKQLFLDPQMKGLVFEIFNTFAAIEITKDRCLFRQSPGVISMENMNIDEATKVLPLLIKFSSSIPTVVLASHPEVEQFKLWRAIAYTLSALVCASAVTAFLVAGGAFRVVKAFDFWNMTLAWSVPLVLAISFLIYFMIRGFSTSAQVLIHFVMAFGIGMGVLFRYGGAIVNAVWDKSSAQIHHQIVTSKFTTTDDNSTNYHIRVQAWEEGMKDWQFKVGSQQYSQITPGWTYYDIVTKSGYFKFEWIVSKYMANSDKSSFRLGWLTRDFSRWNRLPHSIEGMDPVEFKYWVRWCHVMEEGITNRMNVQDFIDERHSPEERRQYKEEYVRRQKETLYKISLLKPPERLKKFQDIVVSSGYDQIAFYEDYLILKQGNPQLRPEQLRSNLNLKATDQKLWDAYHYFQSLYPSRNQATNDAIERRLAWFDVI